MRSIVVSVTDVHMVFHVLLQGWDVAVESVAKSLYALFHYEDGVYKSRYSIDTIVRGLRGQNNGCGAQVLDAPPIHGDRVVFNFRKRSVCYSSNGCIKFEGTVEEFLASVQPEASLVGKTIVFFYRGGSEEGNRVVKVEKVENKNGNISYFGTDMVKQQYRRYNERNIIGKVIVMNKDGKADVARDAKKEGTPIRGSARRVSE